MARTGMMLRETPEKLLQANGRCETPNIKHRALMSFTASELQRMQFPPIAFVLDPIFAEGVTVIAGRPKIGKSWLMLSAALAVSRGEEAFGRWATTKGDVLFLALEDNPRRLQGRFQKLLPPNEAWPANIHLEITTPRIGSGFEKNITNWAHSVPRPKLVVVDTLRFIRPPREKVSYESDSQDLYVLQKLAHDLNISIVAVHHLRKQAADDPLDAIMGTTGVTGSADSLVTLTRNTAGQIILNARGKDIPETECELDFDKETCTWRVTGDPTFNRLSSARQAILSVLDGESPLGPKDIAERGGLDHDVVRQLLPKLVADGLIKKISRGLYART